MTSGPVLDSSPLAARAAARPAEPTVEATVESTPQPVGAVPGSAPAGPAVDSRPRSRRLVAPLATLGVVVASTAYVGAVDPGQPGHYPLCPLRAIFGVDCPGCGGLRCVHALTRGDVAAAADFNLLAVVLLPVAVAAWLVWFRRAWTGTSPALTPARQRLRPLAPMVLVVVMLAFAVVRNFVPYLGSTT